MKVIRKFRYERFELNWLRLSVQGMLIFLTGLTFAFASAIKSDAVIMTARFFSWLPVCGMILLALGLLGCLDALFAKEQRDFIQNLQVGILDSVVGVLIILGISQTPERLSSLIAAFLLVRAIARIAMAFTLGLPRILLTLICGLVSIVLGVMVYQGWPTEEGWFLALSLSVEIAFRGVSMIMFALWLKEQKTIPVLLTVN